MYNISKKFFMQRMKDIDLKLSRLNMWIVKILLYTYSMANLLSTYSSLFL